MDELAWIVRMPERKPIFYDQERRRWRRTRLALEIAGALFTLVLLIFVLNIGRNPELPEILRTDTHAGLHAIRWKPKRPLRGRRKKVAALGKVPQSYDPLRAAFYVSDDYTALASLEVHYNDLDLLIPEALAAVSADGNLHVDPDPKLAAFLQSLQAKNPPVDLQVMAMVNNYDAKKNVWCPPENAADAGESGGAEAAGRRRSRNTPTRSTSPASWSISNRCRNRACRISSTSRTISRRALHAREPETDGRAARRRLELRLQILRRAGGRDHPDELRFPLADVVARAHRAAGLVRQEHRQHGQAGAARQADHGHRQVRLRLAGENEKGRLAAGGAGDQLPAGRGHRGRIRRGRSLRSRFLQPALFLRRREQPRAQRLDARRRHRLQRAARRRARRRSRHGHVAAGARGSVDVGHLGRDARGRSRRAPSSRKFLPATI